ncbi:hypothetical protein ABH939_006004 [Rhodococcus sp. 27YEA6]
MRPPPDCSGYEAAAVTGILARPSWKPITTRKCQSHNMKHSKGVDAAYAR